MNYDVDATVAALVARAEAAEARINAAVERIDNRHDLASIRRALTGGTDA
jgi:hypothetical protein